MKNLSIQYAETKAPIAAPEQMQFPQVLVKGTEKKEAANQGVYDFLIGEGFKPYVPPSEQRNTQQARAVAPPLKANGTKEDRKKSREKNQAGSMRIPEKFHVANLTENATIVAFPEKWSARTGNTYYACQVEVNGTKFCILDSDELAEKEVGDIISVTFVTSDNPNIASGFECKVN